MVLDATYYLVVLVSGVVGCLGLAGAWCWLIVALCWVIGFRFGGVVVKFGCVADCRGADFGFPGVFDFCVGGFTVAWFDCVRWFLGVGVIYVWCGFASLGLG